MTKPNPESVRGRPRGSGDPRPALELNDKLLAGKSITAAAGELGIDRSNAKRLLKRHEHAINRDLAKKLVQRLDDKYPLGTPRVRKSAKIGNF